MMRKFYFIFLVAFLCSSLSFAGQKKSSSTTKDTVTAQSWLVADGDGNMIHGTNTDSIRSIASITKLMTVMAVIDSGANLTEQLTVRLHNRPVTRQQLIDFAMIRSDNTAAKLLCDTYPDGYHRCIIDMNRRAQSLGMINTLFTEPTGLLNSNVSTANDLLKLVTEAAKYPVIVSASNSSTIEIQGGRNTIVGSNTNPIIGRSIEFLVSKTGYIRDSGGCIVMMLNTVNGIRTVILLGSQSIKTRIPEAKYLAEKF